ncbi:hypothetical protein AVU43_gp06 [Ralstonia phage RSJ5]|uniref:Uncharacterized protein n=1 Tax=Ralstonia phage RSJ5 TaxID=1538364 RepID=A0A077KRW2_9CAUD|nr:hypothetical protein AVU43_gp06 [Ralstonia phage RSJ5]BAP34900.1 hypothetical protein [Ralstonia phage RSJ5]
MSITLNVGSLTSPRYGKPVSRVSLQHIISVLHSLDFTICKQRLQPEPGEDCHVLVVLDDLMDGSVRRRLYQAAQQLEQDCIAFVTFMHEAKHAYGSLVGPHAINWAPFRPHLFHLWHADRYLTEEGVAVTINQKEAA